MCEACRRDPNEIKRRTKSFLIRKKFERKRGKSLKHLPRSISSDRWKSRLRPSRDHSLPLLSLPSVETSDTAQVWLFFFSSFLFFPSLLCAEFFRFSMRPFVHPDTYAHVPPRTYTVHTYPSIRCIRTYILYIYVHTQMHRYDTHNQFNWSVLSVLW